MRVCARDVGTDQPLQVGEMPMDLDGCLMPSCGQGYDKGSAIGSAYFARDQLARRQPVKDARERRALVREPFVQLGDGRCAAFGEQRQDVRLALRQRVLTEGREIQTDSVCGSMKRRNQAKRHLVSSTRE